MTSDRTANDSQHLSCIEVADSQFLGFVKRVEDETAAIAFQKLLKLQYPHAAHIPYAWIASIRDNDRASGSSDDEEPPNSAGPILLEQLCSSSLASSSRKGEGHCLGMFVVRFFGNQFLGVTCGRLSQCYRSVSRLALHRYFHPDDTPQELEFLNHNNNESLYGLGAGDTELILNVVEDVQNELLDKVENELEWGGFKGNVGEVLPRLQNMQADIEVNSSNDISTIPVYRYPGNYRGDEWETYQWGPTSKMICTAVEEKLLVKQKMNHCVANLYRDGNDFIDHHSDKDLDLHKNGVIVSFSLGTERIMEIRRRSNPKDITRILLPRYSMLVLGPKTNAQFTHSILKQESANNNNNNDDKSGDSKTKSEPRISLTFRNCTTIMDKRTGRLIGEGSAIAKNWEEYNNLMSWEQTLFFLAFCFSSSFVPKISTNAKHHGLFLTGLFGLSWWGFTSIRKRMIQNYEEQKARAFFSRKSATGLKY